jgi:glycosyltransferase involved in cell wall biosynthesis
MRVLHVVPSFYPAFVYGGPIYSVYELCAELTRLGCEVHVLTTDANGPHRVLDVPKRHDVTLPPGFSVRYCPRLYPHSVSFAFLRKLPAAVRWADVVHLTGVYSFPTFPALFLARRFRKKVVWSPRGCLTNWAGSRRNLQKALWTKIAATLAAPQTVLHLTSQQELSGSHGRFGRFCRFRPFVIPNGVKMPPDPPPTPLFHPSMYLANTLKILFLGRIHPIKCIENLLHACSLLNGAPDGAPGPDHRASDHGALGRPWSLVIAGPGDPDYIKQLQSLASSLRLRNVTFPGPVYGEDKTKLLFSSDLLVLPSHSENFGMVISEALAHGVPVIASKGTPWNDLERVGCGLWVDNTISSLAEAINQLSNSPRREMGRRGREWMRAEFSWRSIAQQMLDLYRELMNEEYQAELVTPPPDRIQSWGA